VNGTVYQKSFLEVIPFTKNAKNRLFRPEKSVLGNGSVSQKAKNRLFRPDIVFW